MDKKKVLRILHLLDSGGMYGAENVVINLSREMIAAGKFEPVVGCIVQKDNESVDLYDVAQKNGIEARKILINNFLLFRDLRRFTVLLKELRIDLIHCHGYKASVFAFVAKAGIPVLATCHLWFEGPERPLKTRAMIALEKFIYRFLPVIVAVSEEIRQILLEAGIASEKVLVVRNGIVLSDYGEITSSTRKRLQAELGLQKGDVCVLNVGRLTEQKSQCDIVDAARLVNNTNRKVKFFIVGDGALREALQQQIRSCKVEETVFLLGFRNDIPDLLQLADLFILPSLDEGMPMALLEAVASRVPVIATAVGDVGKLIVHCASGIIVGKNDVTVLAEEIIALAADTARQNKMAEEALRRVLSLYSSQVMYGQYDKIYRGLLG